MQSHLDSRSMRCRDLREGGMGMWMDGWDTDRCDDAGQEQAEGVEGGVAAHVDGGVEPGLPILDGGPEIRHSELLVLGR